MSKASEFECHLAHDLVRWITLDLKDWGGVVLIGGERENLCRRAQAGENAQCSGAAWIVEAQGLPNLIHEYVHALFQGGLADDHGFDYGEIPLDLASEAHRGYLWEELACCGISATTCAPLHTQPQRFARDWFVEQFEIQGVFHGLEHDLGAFRARIDAQFAQAERVAELEQTVARAQRMFSSALRRHDPDYRLPDCEIRLLWQDYRDYAGLGRVGPDWAGPAKLNPTT